jgi:hypothetical protein
MCTVDMRPLKAVRLLVQHLKVVIYEITQAQLYAFLFRIFSDSHDDYGGSAIAAFADSGTATATLTAGNLTVLVQVQESSCAKEGTLVPLRLYSSGVSSYSRFNCNISNLCSYAR